MTQNDDWTAAGEHAEDLAREEAARQRIREQNRSNERPR